MTSLFKKGNRYSYSNTGAAINSGDVVVLASGTTGFIGVAITAIAATTGTGELAIGGGDENVVTLTKNTGEVFTDAQVIYWDATNKRLTGTSSSNTRAGRSYGTFNSAAATAQVLLNKA